jgi:hypothetical protein
MRTDAPDRRHDDSRDRREHRAEAEHGDPQPPEIDPERAHHFAVMGAGLDDGAIGRLLDHQPDQENHGGREARRIEPVGRPDQVGEDEPAAHRLRHGEHIVARAPHQPNRLLDHHGDAEGEQQAIERVLAVGAPHAQLDRDADHAHHQRRDQQRRGVTPSKRHCGPGFGETGRQRRPRAEQLHRHIGAEREQRPVRQVDLLHQADDQHEAERDQREQQAEGQPVDQMRQKIEHAAVPMVRKEYLSLRGERRGRRGSADPRRGGAYKSTLGTCS